MKREATAGLLERRRELEAIEGVLAAAAAGSGGLLYLEGPPGVGKTRLLEAARDHAREQGLRALRARGSELERDFAHSLVRQLLEPVVGAARASDDDADGLLAGSARHARPALGLEPAGDPGPHPPDSSTVMHALYWVCAGLAEHEPLALLVDDVHWADAPSLRFLAYLAARVDTLPVALLVAARPGEPGIEQSPLLQLAADPSTVLLRPRPLSSDAIGEVVANDLEQEGHPEFIEACVAVTGGNPFLLHELLRACSEDAIAPTAASVARVSRLVPATVSHAILLRLGRLPAAAAAVAQAVCVLGADADVRRVAAITGLDEAEVARVADALAAGALLRPGRPLAFAHPLVDAAVAGDMPAARRAERHAAAARLLSTEGAPAERVAVHLLAVDPAADPLVVHTLQAAAQRASAQGAPDVAAGYLRRALAEPPAAPDRASVLLAAGEAEARAGEAAALEHLEAAARDAQEDSLRLRASVELGRAVIMSGRTGAAVAVFDRALERLPPSERDIRLLLEAAVVGAALLDADAAPRVADRLERLRNGLGKRGSAPWNALGVVAMHIAMSNGAASEAAELGVRALAREGPLPELADQAPAFYHACQALAWTERYGAVRAAFDGRLAAMTAAGSLPQIAAASSFRAWLNLRTGFVADAESDARSALEAERSHAQPLFRPLSAAMLIHALLEREGPRSAERELAALDAVIDQPSLHASLALHARGRLNLARGAIDEALTDLLRCGRRLERHGATSPAVAPWRSDAAVALAMRGERERAVELADEELALAREFGTPRALGLSLRAAGVVRGGREGIELLQEAAGVLEESQAPLDHARSLVDLGAALRRAKQRSAAREHLRQALDRAHRSGAGPLAARAETELRATGARPRSVVLTGVESLTPSERRVAELAADGRTNRMIAQALFVTARTVEGHLTHVYRKLDLSSREELAAALDS